LGQSDFDLNRQMNFSKIQLWRTSLTKTDLLCLLLLLIYRLSDCAGKMERVAEQKLVTLGSATDSPFVADAGVIEPERFHIDSPTFLAFPG
jgi:hypothetical protein